eukprot:TRINITY_DN2491_c0_g1_i1.p1 TRINITY_DN2491_c0_g1~~TRINITY_DN2491_c0_g1_i1.p1  ORF type:complete len:441 (+),score=37.65 TRINITY_DN2491_c0_g1_i1:58-1380(+)
MAGRLLDQCWYLVRRGHQLPPFILQNDQAVFKVGRNGGNHMDISLEQQCVSRHHLNIVRHGDPADWRSVQWYAEDLNGINGTYVNKIRIPPRQLYLLKPGDTIQFGHPASQGNEYDAVYQILPPPILNDEYIADRVMPNDSNTSNATTIADFHLNSSLEPMSTLVPKSKEILRIIGQGVDERNEGPGDHVLNNQLTPDSNGDDGMEDDQNNDNRSDNMNNSVHNCQQYLAGMMLTPPSLVPWTNDPLGLAPTQYGVVEWTNPQEPKVAIDENVARDDGIKVIRRLHSGEILFSCDQCDKLFQEKDALMRHKDEDHLKEKPYCCKVCGLSFATNKSLQSHKRQHSGDERHVCQDCGRVFGSKRGVNQHRRVAHSCEARGGAGGDHPFACGICGGLFSSKINLRSHLRMHAENSMYPCRVCDKLFVHKAHLKAHEKTHDIEA